MPRYAALLRAINVGGHTVKMDELRALFESVPLKRVESVIASGNILFESASTDAAKLESRIEAKLEKALGYEVGTYLRTGPELAAVSASPTTAVASPPTSTPPRVSARWSWC